MEQTDFDRKEYMKNYMRMRRNKDIEKDNAYQQSLRMKKKQHISQDEFKKYGAESANVKKANLLLTRLKTTHPDFLLELLQPFMIS